MVDTARVAHRIYLSKPHHGCWASKQTPQRDMTAGKLTLGQDTSVIVAMYAASVIALAVNALLYNDVYTSYGIEYRENSL